MNKCVKRLIESLFDDDFEDIVDNRDDLSSDFAGKIMKNMLKYCESYLTEQTFSNSYIDIKNVVDKKVHSEVEGSTVAFYYETKKPEEPKVYLTHVSFRRLNDAQKFIDELNEFSISNVLLRYNLEVGRYVNAKDSDAINNIIDLKNINFISVGLKGVYPKNFYVNGDDLKEEKLYSTVFEEHNYYYKGDVDINLLRCWIDNETIDIESTDSISLMECYNMNDYSFIKKVNNTFRNATYSYKGLPKTGNLTGLPNGKYRAQIEFNDERTVNEPYQPLDGKVKINFVGFPSNCSEFTARIRQMPWRILPYMSFEGITMQNLPKFNFEAGGFPGKNYGIMIQLGPYKFEANCRRWKPTKPQWKTILTSKDWFLDCYSSKNGPHREYVEPDNKEAQETFIKEKSKIDSVNKRTEDKKEDAELMKENCIKYLKAGATYFGNNWVIRIKSLGDRFISYTLMKRLSITDGHRTYEAFCKWLDHTSFKLEKGGTETLRDVIVKPVEERRAKIVEQRKEEAKQLRKELRNKAKENNVVKQTSDETNNDEIQPVKKRRGRPRKSDITAKNNTEVNSENNNGTEVTNNSNVKIYDYSDRAIAIYGDYKDILPIKDKLKEIGCRYNKFLNINGVKTPGWIVSAKKRAEVEKIINNKN